MPDAPADTTDRGAAAAGASAFVGTFALMLGAIALLLFVDLGLARVDRRESDAHAVSLYADGRVALAHGRADEAAALFARSVAIDRTNLNYALALAEARLDAGQSGEAERLLRDLLDRVANDGAVNLAMAHTLVRERRANDAKAYFHRAIFGRWGADSLQARTAARFELIDLLSREHAAQELLAELLPLADAPPDSVQLRARIGRLFITAGSPARGAAIFRELLRTHPGDAAALAGMGDAALAIGNFRTARADYAEASRTRPGDEVLAGQLALADTILALDPTARGIGARARYVRSRGLLARTMAATDGCAAPAAGMRALADSARTMLIDTNPADPDAAGESMVALAGDLWDARPTGCAVATSDDALRLLHARLGR